MIVLQIMFAVCLGEMSDALVRVFDRLAVTYAIQIAVWIFLVKEILA